MQFVCLILHLQKYCDGRSDGGGKGGGVLRRGAAILTRISGNLSTYCQDGRTHAKFKKKSENSNFPINISLVMIINTKTLCEYTPYPCKIFNVILAQNASDPFKIDVRRRKGNTKMKGRKVQVGVF